MSLRLYAWTRVGLGSTLPWKPIDVIENYFNTYWKKMIKTILFLFSHSDKYTRLGFCFSFFWPFFKMFFWGGTKLLWTWPKCLFFSSTTLTEAHNGAARPTRRVTHSHKYLTALSALDTDHLDLCNDTQSHTISCEILPYNQWPKRRGRSKPPCLCPFDFFFPPLSSPRLVVDRVAAFR